jgi:hypothetical protein
MVWPPQNAPLFVYKQPCCVCPACYLNLPADPMLAGTTIYTDYVAAQADMDANVYGCIVYNSETLPNPFNYFNTLTAGTATFEIQYQYPVFGGPPGPPGPPGPFGSDVTEWFAATVFDGTVKIPYSVSTGVPSSMTEDVVTVTIYNSDYTVAYTLTDSTQGDTSGTFTAFLTPGRYLFEVYVNRYVPAGTGAFNITADFQFEMPPGSIICSVQAEYLDTDGETTDTLSCCSFQCRSKTDSKCGFSEFGTPSSPPKYYRTVSISGTIESCSFTAGGCTTFISNSLVTLSGACAFDPVTQNCANGVDNDSSQYTQQTGTHCGDGSGSTTTGDFCSLPSFITLGTGWTIDFETPMRGLDIVWDSVSQTTTGWTLTGSGNCDPGGGGSTKTTGSVTATLSDEDTETDVIARVTLAPWSAWGPPQESDSEPCRAAWSFAGTDNEYTVAQWQITRSNLAPSTEYQVHVYIYRTVYGEDDFTLFQTLVINATTDAAGNFTATGDIPNTEGYESLAQTDCIFTIV